MTGALAGLAGFFPRLGRDHHQPAISHPALGDDVVGKMLDLAAGCQADAGG